MATVVAILIAATEALAEVIVVVGSVYIKASIAVVTILIGIRVPVAGRPAILSVCRSSAKALLVAVVHGSPEQLRAVSIRLVVATTAIVSITWGRIEVWITIIVIVTLIVDTYLQLT